jgi:hypothetical protein
VDRVIPPVPVRQWVISVPERLRRFLADRPEAVTALATIFRGEIERLLREAAGMSHAENAAKAAVDMLGVAEELDLTKDNLQHSARVTKVMEAAGLPEPCRRLTEKPGRVPQWCSKHWLRSGCTTIAMSMTTHSDFTRSRLPRSCSRLRGFPTKLTVREPTIPGC